MEFSKYVTVTIFVPKRGFGNLTTLQLPFSGPIFGAASLTSLLIYHTINKNNSFWTAAKGVG